MLLLLHPYASSLFCDRLAHDMHSCAYHVQVIKNLSCCNSTHFGYMLSFFQDVMCVLDVV